MPNVSLYYLVKYLAHLRVLRHTEVRQTATATVTYYGCGVGEPTPRQQSPSLRSPVVDEERMRPGQLVGASALSFLQCFDSDGLLREKASGLQKPVTYPQRTCGKRRNQG